MVILDATLVYGFRKLINSNFASVRFVEHTADMRSEWQFHIMGICFYNWEMEIQARGGGDIIDRIGNTCVFINLVLTAQIIIC